MEAVWRVSVSVSFHGAGDEVCDRGEREAEQLDAYIHKGHFGCRVDDVASKGGSHVST